ncbi:phosphomannomutase [Pseudoalteromonas sp. MER144-MNA-CIBAN-0113]|uniref:phosphomannomutase n=1 Tax=Pseudoalteromonas sp. MER144-MNA-CIBAN-0113 TaxID=3140429 RepID=UPI00332F118D
MDSSIIIEQSGIEFGTSGARGLVTQFSNEVCFAFTLAFLSTQGEVKRIALAIDNRPSSPAIAKACFSAARAMGVEVDFYGVIPTPALAFKSQEDSVPAIMVTGSHIPFDRNGLKFYTKTGEITKADETNILSVKAQVNHVSLFTLPEPSKVAFELYLERYLSVFSNDLLKNKKIGVYQHSSAGRELYPLLFRALGAEVVCLGYSDNFIPIDTEAVGESDRKQAKVWSTEYKLDAIFSTDGDGDRPLLADENGNYFTGDILCLLAAKSLGIQSLSVPVSCTSSIEKSGFFKKVIRTKIGSPYVIEAFKALQEDYSSVAGFEANGGFLLASDIYIENTKITRLATRDALLPVLAVLSLIGNQKLSSALELLPHRFTHSDRLQNIDKELSSSIINLGKQEIEKLLLILNLEGLKIASVIDIDGLRLTFSNEDVVHIRPSGNAPELRCYTESNSFLNAKKLADKVLASIKHYIKS